MKNAALLLTVLIAFGVHNAEAAKEKKKKAVAVKGAGHGKKLSAGSSLSRDVVFDGSMINGRYHTAGEAVTTVETEKKMNELVGFRRDFKDRLAVERARLKGN